MTRITLINKTDETVRLALFMAPVRDPDLATIAWKVVAPPPGGSTTVELPPDFAVQARYSSDPDNPSHLDTTTAAVSFSETTAAFSVDSVASGDGKAAGAVIHQRFTDLVLNEVRVANQCPIGVEVSILRDGDPIYPPRVVWPGALLMEDVRGSIHVAVVSQFVASGQKMVQEEISLTQTELLPGGTLEVTGSQWTGYTLTSP